MSTDQYLRRIASLEQDLGLTKIAREQAVGRVIQAEMRIDELQASNMELKLLQQDMRDPRDRILQTHVPTIMVPRYGDLPKLEANGHRYLIGETGLFIEVRRPWMHAILEVATDIDTRLPYSKVEFCGITIQFDWRLFCLLIEDFIVWARRKLPNEFGAWIVWKPSALGDQLWLEPLGDVKATPGSLEFTRPRLDDDVHIICDIHSHGRLPAFFSATDDADDAGEVKYSAVVGELHSDHPQCALRLCLPGGLFINADELGGA